MDIGKILIIGGASILLLGVLISYAPWTISWFGNLPGDVRYEGENSKVFIPITSMVIVSVVLSVLLNLFVKR